MFYFIIILSCPLEVAPWLWEKKKKNKTHIHQKNFLKFQVEFIF